MKALKKSEGLKELVQGQNLKKLRKKDENWLKTRN